MLIGPFARDVISSDVILGRWLVENECQHFIRQIVPLFRRSRKTSNNFLFGSGRKLNLSSLESSFERNRRVKQTLNSFEVKCLRSSSLPDFVMEEVFDFEGNTSGENHLCHFQFRFQAKVLSGLLGQPWSLDTVWQELEAHVLSRAVECVAKSAFFYVTFRNIFTTIWVRVVGLIFDFKTFAHVSLSDCQ